jgi:hypothetical protein
MSRIRLQGATSGFIELAAPDVADDGVLVLPTAAEGFGLPGIGSNVVSTTLSSLFTTTSNTFTALTGLTATITPSSDTSKILIVCNLAILSDTDGGAAFARLMRDSTAIGIGDAAGVRERASFGYYVQASAFSSVQPGAIVFLDSPGVDTATTYSIEVSRGSGAIGTVHINSTFVGTNNAATAALASTLTLIEVAV